MWIIPKQLLKCAPDMEALDLESKTSLASDCEPLHIVSLRGSLKPISSVRWKKDSWMQHLYGAILKPSHTNRFTDWWTSSLRDTHVSHLAQQEKEQERKTQDIFGLGSQTEFDFFNQECASLKTSKDTFRWDSPQSSVIWKNWVTQCRGEYSARLKSAHRTSASGSSSWPTIRASEYKDTGPIGSKSHDHMLGKGYLCAVVTQDAANWPTATATNRVRNEETLAKCAAFRKRNANQNTVPLYLEEVVLREELHGQAAPANPSTDGSRQGLWPTARSLDGQVGESLETWEARHQRKAAEGINLHRPLPIAVEQEQRKQWATPRAGKTTDEKPETWAARQAKGDVATMPLTAQVKMWRTPSVAEEKNQNTSTQIYLQNQVGATPKAWATPNAFCYQPPENTEQWTKRAEYQQTEKGVNLHKPVQSQVLHENEKVMGAMPPSAGKLNPRWVETLMGLPVGWTMPSCKSPVTIEPTNCDCSATESCLPPQSELFNFFGTK
jgi:hypothetical protein